MSDIDKAIREAFLAAINAYYDRGFSEGEKALVRTLEKHGFVLMPKDLPAHVIEDLDDTRTAMQEDNRRGKRDFSGEQIVQVMWMRAVGLRPISSFEKEATEPCGDDVEAWEGLQRRKTLQPPGPPEAQNAKLTLEERVKNIEDYIRSNLYEHIT